ncbi:hypothetical protein D3C87_2116320 [compost metagenome]
MADKTGIIAIERIGIEGQRHASQGGPGRRRSGHQAAKLVAVHHTFGNGAFHRGGDTARQ